MLEGMGYELVEVDLSPFFEVGALLYDGPWVSERLAGLEAFVQQHPESVLPVIRSILANADRYSATEAFRAVHRLAEIKRSVEPLWENLAALVVPSVPLHPRIDEVLVDPIAANARLGKYSTFANLLDMTGVAVPAGFRADGLPSGVTLLGPWGCDATLLSLGDALHRGANLTLGATGWPMPPARKVADGVLPDDHLALAVVGAHLTGQPLNRELTGRGAWLWKATRTAPSYRLFALTGTTPPKPGLLRLARGEGARIAVEVWALPKANVGAFVADVPQPLTIGTIETEEGLRVHGFLCEPFALEGARDITKHGGWVAYLSSQAS
jgi:allophanate hydrolase